MPDPATFRSEGGAPWETQDPRPAHFRSFKFCGKFQALDPQPKRYGVWQTAGRLGAFPRKIQGFSISQKIFARKPNLQGPDLWRLCFCHLDSVEVWRTEARKLHGSGLLGFRVVVVGLLGRLRSVRPQPPPNRGAIEGSGGLQPPPTALPGMPNPVRPLKPSQTSCTLRPCWPLRHPPPQAATSKSSLVWELPLLCGGLRACLYVFCMLIFIFVCFKMFFRTFNFSPGVLDK